VAAPAGRREEEQNELSLNRTREVAIPALDAFWAATQHKRREPENENSPFLWAQHGSNLRLDRMKTKWAVSLPNGALRVSRNLGNGANPDDHTVTCR
jgi:hypothetical protein